MLRLKRGDRSAFTPVYETLWPVVKRFAERSVGPQDGQDVAQQALIKLFEQAVNYNEQHEVMPWALSIAAWEIKTVLKKRTRRKEEPLSSAGEPETSDTSDAMLRKLLIEEAEEVMALLTDRDRETLALAFSEEGSGPTFRKRKQRALTRLRNAWREMHG